MLLLASLAAWIIFTLPLGFIQPPATSCIERKNATDFELRTPQVPRILKRSIDESMLEELSFGKYATDSGSSFTRCVSTSDVCHVERCPLHYILLIPLGWNVRHVPWQRPVYHRST